MADDDTKILPGRVFRVERLVQDQRRDPRLVEDQPFDAPVVLGVHRHGDDRGAARGAEECDAARQIDRCRLAARDVVAPRLEPDHVAQGAGSRRGMTGRPPGTRGAAVTEDIVAARGINVEVPRLEARDDKECRECGGKHDGTASAPIDHVPLPRATW